MRPDGYVAMTAGRGDLSEVDAYLTRLPAADFRKFNYLMPYFAGLSATALAYPAWVFEILVAIGTAEVIDVAIINFHKVRVGDLVAADRANGIAKINGRCGRRRRW